MFVFVQSVLCRYLGNRLVVLPQLGRLVVGGGEDPAGLNTTNLSVTSRDLSRAPPTPEPSQTERLTMVLKSTQVMPSVLPVRVAL